MRRALLVPALVAPALISACGSNGTQSVVRSGPASRVATSSSTSQSAAPAGSASATTPRAQAVSVSPSSGLRDGQQVAVTATGFTPGEPLQVIECAARQQQTGPGDCNLAGILSASADAAGTVSARLRVVRGPFGANKIVCSASQPCLVSVTQATLSPTEEADAPISFAAAP